MNEKASILIVEDSFIVAYHLQTTLENEGYKVIGTIDSGEGALDFIKTHSPDLVLMDIMLNGKLDGVETARMIRAEYDLPIIYITALTDRDTIQRAKVTEPYGYLTKPFEDREIFTVIEMALYKHNIENRLKQSEEKYFSTVRSISDAVILINQFFKITYINPSAEEMLGYVFSEIVNQPLTNFFRLVSGETGDVITNPFFCEITNTRANSMPGNLILISKDGSGKLIGDGSMSPIIDNKGKCTGLVVIFKDVTVKIEHERLLQSIQIERMGALLEGQEKERNRIAKDLHDGLGQILTAIKMNVGMAIPDADSANVLHRLIDEAIQESVRISENLLPSSLRNFNLDTSLNSLCQQMDFASASKVCFEVLGETLEVDHNQKVNFYRIAQEAINNAVKHAKASCINVQIAYDDSAATLTVEDDGCGMIPSGEGFSFRHGLANMKDRATIMGGKLTIESDESRGTLIIVEAPLTHKSNGYT